MIQSGGMAMAKGKKKKPDARQGIIDELMEAASKIDEDGLMFLLRQAQTLVYNLKVDELNKERKKVQAALDENIQRPSGSPGDVYVEQASFGKNFILVIDGVRKTMSREELKAMVKICLKKGESERPETRLLRWLKRYRDDVLLDAGISRTADQRLTLICSYLASNFRLADEDQ
jgi:hypothetical protein